jgi:chemotaxis family two-component system sensor histidine kinase/response regulator PixL
MALNPEIRDQAYQFFIEEAPELLQVIEAGLLMLRSARSTSLVHDLMRAAHSLKGGAASVELDAIATLSHRLENIFKALYSDTLEIDTNLESQLLQAHDCLRLPLMEQIETGYFDGEQALALAEPIFTQIEERLGDALTQADTYIPSSADLGVDMTKCIFELDVGQGLERLAAVVAHPSDYEVAGELRALSEVFFGFAELLNQPGFGAIAATALAALEAHPNRALEITQLALTDFELARQAVLAGKAPATLTQSREIGPCAALVALADSTPTPAPDFTIESIADLEPIIAEQEGTLPSIEDVFGSLLAIPDTNLDELTAAEVSEETQTAEQEWELETFAISPDYEYVDELAADVVEDAQTAEQERQIEEIFAHFPESLDELTADVVEDAQTAEQERQIEEIFAHFPESLDELTAAEVLEETQTAEQERQIEEIFSISAESLDEFIADEVLEETQTAQERELEEILAISPESLNELTAAEVLEDTQTAQEREIEEIFAIFPEYLVDSTDITPEADADTDSLDLPEIIDVEWVGDATSVSGEVVEKTPTLEEAWKRVLGTPSTGVSPGSALVPITSSNSAQEPPSDVGEPTDAPKTLEEVLQSIEQLFESLPPLEDLSASNSPTGEAEVEEKQGENLRSTVLGKRDEPASKTSSPASSGLSVRVDSERLEQINNLVGELAINRNGLSLQNEQLQGSVKELLNRFARVQNMVGDLRKFSDQLLVAPERLSDRSLPRSVAQLVDLTIARTDFDNFDSLELDTYGALYSRLQLLLEDMVQLEESVDDIVLFARATDQKLEQQRQMLTHLRDQLMWARMLPLGEVLHRFPRMLRDFSTTYHKPVNLKLSGTSVLVDKAVLEKLYDPLLHLLRNAFDHGIEPPTERQQKGKPEQGLIEIKAYYQASQTIIEVRDDGQGLNVERIGRRALELGLLSTEQLAAASNNRLSELIFEPGFSTASQVSELSGRGVGLDVVRAQMRSLKGTITVNSSPGVGTTFTLRLPLTLTIAKLLVCFIGPTAVAIPSDSIQEIVIPKAEQIKHSGTQRVLHWREQLVPTYRLADLLNYACPLPETSSSKALLAVPTPQNWALPMLIIRQEQQCFALEIERLVTEQELVIKPFGEAIASPSCTYGCTTLGDGSLIPVLDAGVLLAQLLARSTRVTAITTRFEETSEISLFSKTPTAIKTVKAPTVLVVDDAVALRRTLALSLERAGIRVLQARDGREAIERLQQTSGVDVVICDIEMPNMNGFEFLSHRRQDPELCKIPVVMLTSRSNDKHRWLAMQLGASAYFTKPYLEQDFLGAIKQIVAQSTPESILV